MYPDMSCVESKAGNDENVVPGVPGNENEGARCEEIETVLRRLRRIIITRATASAARRNAPTAITTITHVAVVDAAVLSLDSAVAMDCVVQRNGDARLTKTRRGSLRSWHVATHRLGSDGAARVSLKKGA